MQIRFLTATAALCALVLAPSPAPAAGSDNIFQHIAQPTESYDWSGWYAGFNTGATWNHFDIGKHSSDVNLVDQFYMLPQSNAIGVQTETIATFDFPAHNDQTSNKPIGGGQTGFNFQFGHFVVGGEGGFSGNTSETQSKSEGFQMNTIFIGEKGLSQPLSGQFTTETSITSERNVETDWNGFIGGHVGFAFWRFLIYGSGGAAFTDEKLTAIEKATTDFFSNECQGDCAGVRPTRPATLQPSLDQLGFFVGSVVS
jgi:hypothetical protein